VYWIRSAIPISRRSIAAKEEEHRYEADERPGRAHLGQPLRRQVAGLEDHLRDRSVRRPESGRAEDHRVAERGSPHAAKLAVWGNYTDRGAGRGAAW
jgi:hypothetical protein